MVTGGQEQDRRIDSLIKELSDPIWAKRRYAAEALAGAGVSVIPVLLARLRQEDVNEDTAYWGVKVFTSFGKQSLPALLELLAIWKKRPEYRVFVITALGEIRAGEAVEQLIECLGDEKWIIRKEAATALERIGKSAVPKLKAAFSSGNRDVCYWTVKIIGHLLGKDAVETFKKLLLSDKRDLRYYAITALGEIDDDGAIEAIVRGFDDSSWLVRAQAAEILERKGKRVVRFLRDAFARGSSDTKFWTVRVLIRILKEEAYEFMEKIMASDETEMKFFIISATREMSGEIVFPLLLKALDDNSWLVRKHAAEALIGYGEAGVDRIVSYAEKAQSENVWYWTIQILSRVGGKGLTRLVGMLKQVRKKERLFILQALRESRSRDVVPTLVEMLSDPLWPIRSEAAKTLVEMGAGAITKEILKTLPDANEDMKYWIRWIMKTLGDTGIYELTQITEERTSSPEEKRNAMVLLAIIGTKKSVKPVIQVFRQGTMKSKEELVELLATVDVPEFIHAMLAALGEESAESCYWISKLLARLCRSHIELLLQTLKDRSAEKRIWVVKILGEIGGAEVVPSLLALLKDPDKNVRYEATNVLAKIGGNAISDALISTFMEEDDEGKIAIIGNLRMIVDEKLIGYLIDSLMDKDERMSYWISRLLTEVAGSNLPFLEEKLREYEDNIKVRHWIRKIIDHIKGIAYL